MANTSVAITAGSGTNIDGFTESINSDFRQAIVIADPSTNAAATAVTSSDAGVGATEYGAVVRPIMQDAGKLRTSAFQGDASSFRISAILDSGSVSAKSGDASNLRISAIIDNGSISSKSGDANQIHVSAVQGDAGLMRISSLWTTVGNGLTLATAAYDIGTTATAVVSGVASKKTYVYAIHQTIVPSGGTKWTTGSTDLQGITRLSASSGYTMAVTPPAYILATTSAGQDLALALSGTISASGWVAYYQI